MLTMMYNVQMHLKIDVAAYPWKWIQFWSRQIEKDLLERRMAQKQAAARANRIRLTK
jgi:hypothetical protein